MHALYTRKKYFLTSATFPSLFLFTTSLMTPTVARALQEDEIKNDFFFFFFAQGTFSPLLPYPVTSRTGHGEIIAQEDRE